MQISYRRAKALLLLAIVAAAFALAPSADAQDAYPNRPLRIYIGFAAGSINDLQARVVAQKLSERLGQPVLAENRAGAGGNIAAELVARAAPDGYSLLNAPTGTMVINPAVYSKLPYDPVKDFIPITQISTYPLYLTVTAGLPVSNVKELMAHAKANPDKANLGTTSTYFDMMMALLTMGTDTKFVVVPFKSTPETMTALLSGQTMVGFQEYRSLAPQLQAGKVKALAVMSSARSTDLPTVPSIVEAGFPNASAQPFTGIVAPRATPRPIVERLEREINAIMKLPDVVERWRSLGLSTVESNSAAFGAMIEADIKRWTAVAKAANIKLD